MIFTCNPKNQATIRVYRFQSISILVYIYIETIIHERAEIMYRYAEFKEQKEKEKGFKRT